MPGLAVAVPRMRGPYFVTLAMADCGDGAVLHTTQVHWGLIGHLWRHSLAPCLTIFQILAYG